MDLALLLIRVTKYLGRTQNQCSYGGARLAPQMLY